MPLGPWKDFGSCVAAQKEKGYSDESAKKICGSIEAKMSKATNTANITLANAKITKAKLVLKPKNKDKNIVGNIQETGGASISLQRANNLTSAKTATKTKKDNNNSEYTEDTAPPTSTPVQPGRSVETDNDAVGTSKVCSYCGATNPSPTPEGDAATGMILNGSRFAGDDKDRAAEPGFDDGNVQLVEKQSVKLTKADCAEEEHYVLGVVLEPETEDSQKDIYSEEEIRKTAHNYMANHMHIGLQHNGVIDDRVKILESYIAPCNFDINGQTIKKGTWLLGARILDDELWSAVKKGELTGWSMGGSAIRTEEKVN
jgi:hypothetical protein